MIESNTRKSALQDFMRNVLQVQNHPQLSVVEDNAKSPPPSPSRTTKRNENKAILQFTTPADLNETEKRWPATPKRSNTKSKLGMTRWGDLHYESQQRQLRQEQLTKQIETSKTASNHRFNEPRFKDRPLPSSVIGNGHVAMIRQNSLERHFLAVTAKGEREEEALPTVPEDESVDSPDLEMTSVTRKRQRHYLLKTLKKENRDETSKGSTKTDLEGRRDNEGRGAAGNKQSSRSKE